YFVTKQMQVDLKSNRLHGTLPVLCIMLARSGCTISDVKLLPHGVQIEFVPGGEHRRRTLFYFSADLSNAGLGKNRALFDVLKESGARNSYVKAASYLLHSNEFSMIRN